MPSWLWSLIGLRWADVVKLLPQLFKAANAEVIEAIPVPTFFKVDHERAVNPMTVNSLGVRALVVD